MKIVLAGAGGVIGKVLIPMLVEAGHEVIGLIRNPSRTVDLSSMGVCTVCLDVYDREAVFSVLREAKPDIVIHQLTSLSARNFDDNARIRKEGTRNLVDASLAAGVSRMIAQSIAWAYEPGDGPATESCPLDLSAPLPRRTTIEGVHALENAVSEMPEHVILRYGLFYGAGTWYSREGLMAELARQQQLPATEGVVSFVQVEDAARAAVVALNWPSGAYNIVDHEPAAGTEWLPVFAAALGAPAPIVQQGSGRGESGATNDKALLHGWSPRFSSWREGFLHVLGSD